MNSPKYIGEPKSQEFTGWFSKAKASTHLIRSLLRRLYAKIKLKRNRMVSAKALRFQFLWPDPESGFFYFRSSAFRLPPSLSGAGSSHGQDPLHPHFRIRPGALGLLNHLLTHIGPAKAFLMAAPLFMVWTSSAVRPSPRSRMCCRPQSSTQDHLPGGPFSALILNRDRPGKTR
jgi:hypothetical protein